MTRKKLPDPTAPPKENVSSVVFLDYDGVLNSDEYKPDGDDGFIGIAPYHVNFLNKILDETGARVVLTTSWRKDKNKSDPYEYAVNALYSAGANPGCVIGMTPILMPLGFSDYHVRGREVEAWLKSNPGINNYVILDDIFEFKQEQLPHLVSTEVWEGLREKHVKEAVSILRGTV